MLGILSKLKITLKKPKTIIVCGSSRLVAKKAINQVLKPYLKINSEVFVFDNDFSNLPELDFLMKNSSLLILVIASSGAKTEEKKTIEKIRKLVKTAPLGGYLVFNSDDKAFGEVAELTNLKTLTFGFEEGANFQASDIHSNGGTNFKLNYKGNIVPFWLQDKSGGEQVCAVLASACVGVIFDLNLVEISEALRNFGA